MSHPDEPVLGLELQRGLLVIIDDAEASRLASTELRAEAQRGGA